MTLQSYCLLADYDCVLIVGDLNIHVDKPEDRGTNEMCCVFDKFGLTKHLTQCTHNMDHTRHLVHSKGFNIPSIR